MATSCSVPQKSNANFPDPPRRGHIKAQIFNGLFKSLASTVSRAGESLVKLTGNGGGSASSTPPPSAYNSDAF